MPTDTFHNLPEDKRNRLISAIKAELSRVPFSEVSINKIIHAAGISRGSFYQYFADKTDMLEYILLDYQKLMCVRIIDSLHASGGDVFRLCMDMLNHTIEFGTGEETVGFCKNLFTDLKINSVVYEQLFSKQKKDKFPEEIRENLNLEMLDLRNENDLENMMEILFSISKDAIVEVFTTIPDCERIKQKYADKIMLLKRGFLKT